MCQARVTEDVDRAAQLRGDGVASERVREEGAKDGGLARTQGKAHREQAWIWGREGGRRRRWEWLIGSDERHDLLYDGWWGKDVDVISVCNNHAAITNEGGNSAEYGVQA